MPQTLYEKVAREIPRLSPEERRRIRSLLDALPEDQVPPTEEEFAEEMLRLGVYERMPLPADASEVREPFQPIEIEGEPLSEQIIRERR